MPTPILLDTDIGTDIDDAYALVLAAASPELDLRAVSVVNGDVITRGRIARTLLRAMGRDEVPVLVGESGSCTPGVSRGMMGHEGRGIDLSAAPVDSLIQEPLPQAFGHILTEAGEGFVIISIGALTNVARILRDLPRSKRSRIRGIVSMASLFRGFGEEPAAREHNVACDPVAFQRVLDSGIPFAIIGLNVTGQTRMTRADLEEVKRIGGPLAGALAGMHEVWFRAIGREESPMHDALAVAHLIRADLMEFVPAWGYVDLAAADGTVVYHPESSEHPANCLIAASVDVDAFHHLFFERIRRAMR